MAGWRDVYFCFPFASGAFCAEPRQCDQVATPHLPCTEIGDGNRTFSPGDAPGIRRVQKVSLLERRAHDASVRAWEHLVGAVRLQ